MRWAGRNRLLIRTPFIFLLILGSCASYRSAGAREPMPGAAQEIVYASTDLRHVIVFAPDRVEFGPPLDFRPETRSDPPRYFEPSEGVRCVSLGPPGNSIEYAIKRPIRADERYQCGTTSFRVTRCFGDCQAAVIEVTDRRGVVTSHLYVNRCLGVLAFSQTGDLTQGIPLDAELLRGNVGILADPHFPDCRSF